MPWLVRVVLGESYIPATDAARILLLAACLRLVLGWTKSFPVSIGKPGLRIIAHSVEIVTLLPLVILLGDRVGRDGGRRCDAARHDRLRRRLGGAALPAAPRAPSGGRDEAGIWLRESPRRLRDLAARCRRAGEPCARRGRVPAGRRASRRGRDHGGRGAGAAGVPRAVDVEATPSASGTPTPSLIAWRLPATSTRSTRRGCSPVAASRRSLRGGRS